MSSHAYISLYRMGSNAGVQTDTMLRRLFQFAGRVNTSNTKALFYALKIHFRFLHFSLAYNVNIKLN